MTQVPRERVSKLNQGEVNPKGRFVLYWMIAARRTRYNFGLQRAVQWAKELKKPLVVLEALRVGYPWASRRLHAFILRGMAENAERLAKGGALPYPYVEMEKGQGKGLLSALARDSCLVVTDQFPCFFIPNMQKSAAEQVVVRLEAVDSCGLLPLAAAGREFSTAYSFRRFLQKVLPGHLAQFPLEDPLRNAGLFKPHSITQSIASRWPKADLRSLAHPTGLLRKLPIDQQVAEVELPGGEKPARQALRRFLKSGLARYLDERNQPLAQATSMLSPYLHCGHISSHEIFHELTRQESWAPHLLSSRTDGRREGYWGLSPSAEAFVDQFVTWRELGYVFCRFRPDFAQYDSLSAWARTTLAEHAKDPRPYVYDLDQFARAVTHDPIWNAAQRQLARQGIMHNYLRMLWGKKILEWSQSPQAALKVMIELNNRFALDGRDPNSYSGIFWCLGRFDRAWGPQRPVFGKIRYMSSQSTARKLNLKPYLEKFGPES